MTAKDVKDALGGAAAVKLRGEDYDPNAINETHAVVIVGGRTVILKEAPEAPVGERLQFLSKDAFDLWYANRVEYREGKPVSWAKLWLNDVERRQYEGIEFAPAPPGEDRGREGYYNLWRGFDVEPKPGDCSLFTDHVWENVACDNEHLYDWAISFFAQMVQRPWERPEVSLVLRGKQGCGKTTVGDIIGSLISPHYILADQSRYITGQFNSHMAACLLLQADEGFWAGDKDAEGRLKGLVTSKYQMIERKGVDPIKLRNHVRLFITSNHDWVVPAGLEERRFCVLDVTDARCQDHEYFGAIYEQMAKGGREALLHYLLTWDLERVNLRHIPATEALFEQKFRALGPEEAWWFQRLMDGAHGADGSWEAFVPTSKLVDSYITHSDRIGVKRRAEETALVMKLRKLVPGLSSRRRKTVWEDMVSRRAWGYEFPSLEDCRAHFCHLMKWDVDWGVEDGGG